MEGVFMQTESCDCLDKKHPCPDCRMCQGCSESRCMACRAKPLKRKLKKMSFEEQIALWNSLNASSRWKGPVDCWDEFVPVCGNPISPLAAESSTRSPKFRDSFWIRLLLGGLFRDDFGSFFSGIIWMLSDWAYWMRSDSGLTFIPFARFRQNLSLQVYRILNRVRVDWGVGFRFRYDDFNVVEIISRRFILQNCWIFYLKFHENLFFLNGFERFGT